VTQKDKISFDGQEYTINQVLMDDSLLSRYILRCNGSIQAAETVRDNFPLTSDHPISMNLRHTIEEAKDYVIELPKIAQEYRQTMAMEVTPWPAI
jgi:hypothetical protein